jgi:hypothetical protein
MVRRYGNFTTLNFALGTQEKYNLRESRIETIALKGRNRIAQGIAHALAPIIVCTQGDRKGSPLRYEWVGRKIFRPQGCDIHEQGG